MIAVITTAMLVFARFGALLTMVPVFSATGIPRHVPVLGAVLLTLIVTPTVAVAVAPAHLGTLALAIAGEVGVGLVLGGTVRMVFGAIAMASEMMTMQMGLGNVASLNPLLETQEGPIGTLATLLSAVIFLSADLHLFVLELVAGSFGAIPPGGAVHLTAAARPIGDTVAASFQLGFQLAGPVLLYTWMVNLFIALLTKLAPKMNVYFSIGIGLGSPLGMAVLAFSFPWIMHVHREEIATAVRGLVPLIERIAHG